MKYICGCSKKNNFEIKGKDNCFLTPLIPYYSFPKTTQYLVIILLKLCLVFWVKK